MRPMARLGRVLALASACGLGAVMACGSSPGAKMEAVKTALEKDDAAAIKEATSGYPACAEAPPVAGLPTQATPYDAGCLAQIATAVGSKKGFAFTNPD